MARNRASMREGPLAELFRATEAAQRQQQHEQQELPAEPPVSPPRAAKKTAKKPTPIRADRKSTRLNSSHIQKSRMPSSA